LPFLAREQKGSKKGWLAVAFSTGGLGQGLLFRWIGGIFVMQPHLNKISKNNKQIVPIAPFMGDSDAHDWDISMFF